MGHWYGCRNLGRSRHRLRLWPAWKAARLNRLTPCAGNELKDQTAIVTGGGRGIGRTIALTPGARRRKCVDLRSEFRSLGGAFEPLSMTSADPTHLRLRAPAVSAIVLPMPARAGDDCCLIFEFHSQRKASIGFRRAAFHAGPQSEDDADCGRDSDTHTNGP